MVQIRTVNGRDYKAHYSFCGLFAFRTGAVGTLASRLPRRCFRVFLLSLR